MQASTSIAASLNPVAAAQAGGQAVGAGQGLEGLLAGLFGGEEAATDTGTSEAFSEALAAAMFAPTQAQSAPAAPIVKTEGAGLEPALAAAATQATVFPPSLLTNEQISVVAPAAEAQVEGATSDGLAQTVAQAGPQATEPDVKLALAAVKDLVAPPVVQSQQPVAVAVTAPPVTAPAPVDPTIIPEAAVALSTAQAETPPQIEARAVAQTAPRPVHAEALTKSPAKGKATAPVGEARGESKLVAQPAAADTDLVQAAPATVNDDGPADFAALPDAPSQDMSPDGPSAQAASHHEVRGPAAPAVETPRATTQTVAHLAAQITSKLDGKSTRFDVQLDPHGLGKVDVRVEIAANGAVSAALTFENPQAASELRGRQGELQAALEQAGFDLSKTSLSFSSGGQGQQGLFDQQQQQAQAPVWRGRAFTDLSDTPETAPAPVRQRATTGVDVRI